ncbi:MAG: RuBisCO large subunit C-terminal-like domain-containing protein [Candidatus Diapherotrites archaeon]
MKQIISTLELKEIDIKKLEPFIERWKQIKDLPCDNIEFHETDKNTILVKLYYPLDIFDRSVSQFVTVLFGELSFVKNFGKVKFLELQLPNEVYKWFTGPKFGTEEIKKRFDVSNYPLLMAIIKPSLGKTLTTEILETKIKSVLSGGFNAVKDDEMQGNLNYAPLKHRIKLAKKYQKYIPAINLDKAEDFRKVVSDEKIGAVLINASTLGFPLLHEIKKISKVPIISHPALQGVYGYSFSHKVFAMLHRLFGCDGYICPIADVDYFNVSKQEEKEIIMEFTKDLPIKKTMPLLAGGARINSLKNIMAPYEKMRIPYGLVFGYQIFADDKKSSQMCKNVVEKVRRIKQNL